MLNLTNCPVFLCYKAAFVSLLLVCVSFNVVVRYMINANNPYFCCYVFQMYFIMRIFAASKNKTTIVFLKNLTEYISNKTV